MFSSTRWRLNCALLAEGSPSISGVDGRQIRFVASTSDHRGEVHHGDVRAWSSLTCANNGPHLVVHQSESASVRTRLCRLELGSGPGAFKSMVIVSTPSVPPG
jgi:hypothetical protein